MRLKLDIAINIYNAVESEQDICIKVGTYIYFILYLQQLPPMHSTGTGLLHLPWHFCQNIHYHTFPEKNFFLWRKIQALTSICLCLDAFNNNPYDCPLFTALLSVISALATPLPT